MSLTTNATYDRLLVELNRMGTEVHQSPAQDPTYQAFIQRFPTSALRGLSLDAYCVGKGDGDSFCWWLEHGLEPVLGRYMPGTARGHLLYFAKDGTVYKHRRLKGLSDAEALRYTLRLQATLAEANPAQDLRWIDDDNQIYQRAGVEPRVTVGDGRKLRLLAAYHPEAALPISSSDHVAHFLAALGCPLQNIPSPHAPVARMLLLRDYCELARESCPGLTLQGFMKGLYSTSLGLAPLKDVDNVLRHFAAVPDLAARLKGTGQTDIFCQLVLALHEAGLDLWVTKENAIHAGRTDDPKLLQTVAVLALDLSAHGLSIRLSDDAYWQILDADVAAQAIDAAQTSPRLEVLTHRVAFWPDDYDGSEMTLVVSLTDGAIRNGYIRVPKLQALFPAACIAVDEKTSADTFKLVQPDGVRIDTWVLANRGRIQARFNSLFRQSDLKEGDQAVITKEGDRAYQLAFKRQGNAASPQPSALIGQEHTTVPCDESQNMITKPLNQILYGPPGTGKTYATVARAVEILNPGFYAQHKDERVPGNREALKREFDRLGSTEERRVRFVTFHQSFSYEDFVEGIRAVTDDVQEDSESGGGLAYRVEAGVFKRICEDAKRDKASEAQVGIRPDATVWKMSIEQVDSDSGTRNYCLSHGEARIGWPNTGDLLTQNFEHMTELGSKEKSSLRNFGFRVQPGDVVVCLKTVKTIQAVGVVTDTYQYEPQVPAGVREDYVHRLPVHWLATGINLDITAINGEKQLTLQTVYRLSNVSWPKLSAALLDAKVPLDGLQPTNIKKAPEPYVLIIDEINRGNVSRIFGELITLLEPSKRAGTPEALEVVLPYSKERFSVPQNVYLLGTMNTADRSLSGLDVALRRRFVFHELMPQPQLLLDVTVRNSNVTVSIGQLLEVMNQRIEALLDREHMLGHAYFLPLRQSPTLQTLAEIFRRQVLPLLQEYFFDDWERIRWVLNDHRKKVPALTFVHASGPSFEALFGSNVQVPQHRQSWTINVEAFDRLDSYAAILDVELALPVSHANAMAEQNNEESVLEQ
jgi:hypothetical protein